MYWGMTKRILFETNKRLLWKLAWNMGWKGFQSVRKHKKRLKKGEYFPPFLYVSIINSCNLRCQGCWVDVSAQQQIIDLESMSKLIREAKEMGNRFFGIVGGEPFMHPQLFEILEQHADCYFQIFTNGQLITEEKAKRLFKLGNVTPLISVEGNEIVSNERRGREDVYNKTMQGIHNCLNQNLITGVCTSVCQSNIDDLVNEQWIDRLIEMKVMYTWFHVYRPMGPEPCEDLCLTPEQQLKIRKFVVDMRAKKPIGIVDAYHDHNGKALCPAVTGISHHINPWGDIEPCPVIQFSRESIHDPNRTLGETFIQSEFLHDFRKMVQSTTRGCIILERPDLLEELIDRHSAKDATVRKTALAELKAMKIRPSQYNPDQEVPEKNLVYRLVKRFCYQDFGVYDGHDHSTTAAPAMIENSAAEDRTVEMV